MGKRTGQVGVGSQAQKTDPHLSQLGDGTSVTGQNSCENCPDQHLLEMPPCGSPRLRIHATVFMFFSCIGVGDNWARLSPQLLQDGSQGQGATGSVSGALVVPVGPRPQCGLCSQGCSAVLGWEAGEGPGREAGGWKPGLGFVLGSACSSEGYKWSLHEVVQRKSSRRKLNFYLKGCTCGFGVGQPQWVPVPLLLTE